MTEEQIELMQSQIAQIEGYRYHRQGGIAMPYIQIEPPDDSLAFNDLTDNERREVLSAWPSWEAFDQAEESLVIEAVIDGKDWVSELETGRIISELERGWGQTPEAPDYGPADKDAMGQVLEGIQGDYELRIQEAIERGRYRAANDNEKGRTR